MRAVLLLVLALASRTGAATSRTATSRIAQSLWDPASLHLFVDQTGLTSVTGLSLKAHRPAKTYELAVQPSEPWDGGGPQMGLIEGYSSVVQVSADEIRIYYVRSPNVPQLRPAIASCSPQLTPYCKRTQLAELRIYH